MENQQLCQSCGLQMVAPGIRGTNKDGSESTDYCRFCFRGGRFANPNMTEEEMVEKVAGAMSEKSQINLDQAKNMAKHFVPKLKRWKELRSKQMGLDNSDLEFE
jgi:hypothetical protein